MIVTVAEIVKHSRSVLTTAPPPPPRSAAYWELFLLRYGAPQPDISIFCNAVTSVETVLNGNSVKKMLYSTPPPYFIVLASSMKTKEVNVIDFHRIVNECCWHRLVLRERACDCVTGTVVDKLLRQSAQSSIFV